MVFLGHPKTQELAGLTGTFRDVIDKMAMALEAI